MANNKESEEREYKIYRRVPTRELSNPSSVSMQKLEEDLNQLPIILGDPTHWTLTGGIAIQIAYGAWYREPGNINISVHEEHIGEVAEHAAMHAPPYGLFSRGWQITPWRRWKKEWYEKVRWNDNMLSRNYKTLRFLKQDSHGPVNNPKMTDLIDVQLHREINRTYDFYPELNSHHVVSLNGDKSILKIPFKVAEQNISYQTKSGQVIQVRNYEYMMFVKRWLMEESGENRLDKFDLEKLEEIRQANLPINTIL